MRIRVFTRGMFVWLVAGILLPTLVTAQGGDFPCEIHSVSPDPVQATPYLQVSNTSMQSAALCPSDAPDTALADATTGAECERADEFSPAGSTWFPVSALGQGEGRAGNKFGRSIYTFSEEKRKKWTAEFFESFDGAKRRPWMFGLFYTHTEFSKFEGADLEEFGIGDLDLDRIDLSLSFPMKFPDALVVNVPHVETSLESDSGNRQESDFGDMSVYYFHAFDKFGSEQPSKNNWKNYVGIEAAVTLPTGDEDKGLGYGDPTAYVGVRGYFGSKGVDSKTIASALTPAAGFIYNDPDGEGDMHAFLLDASGIIGWDTGGVRLGMKWIFETGDGRPASATDPGRDAINTATGFVEVVQYTPSRNILVHLGLSKQLSDDGLSDSFTAWTGLTFRLPSKRTTYVRTWEDPDQESGPPVWKKAKDVANPPADVPDKEPVSY